MKSSKMYVKMTLAILLLIAIIIAIYYYSDGIFKVKNETKLIEMNLPDETQDLIIGLEDVKIQKGKGVDSILVKGWVLKQNVKDKKKEAYMVLKSNLNTLVFKLGKADIIRPDVEEYFHLDKGINNHGFEMSIPTSILKEKNYQVGFVIEDKTGKYFSMSPKIITIAEGVATFTELNPVADSAILSSQVSLTLKKPTTTINYNLEKVTISDDKLDIGGWAYLQGLNSDFLKSYILLKKNETVVVYSSVFQLRKDVTNYFKESRLNYDSSGFSAQIATGKMEKGRYQVGIYTEKGNQTGIVYSEKYVEIDK